MCRIDYEARQHRLRVAGDCTPSDAGSIEDAIDAFGRGHRTLIVDLTALTDCDAEVARAVVRSAQDVSPCRVTVLRKHGTEVDRMLSGAVSSS